MSRRGLLLAAGLVLLLPAVPSEAYLKLATRVGDRVVTVRWAQQPVRYFVTDDGGPGVSALEFRQAIERAFATWQQVPQSALRFELAGVVSGPPVRADGMSVLGFADRADLERVLGATRILLNTLTGEIVEVDIFFNTAFDWSVAPGGAPGRFDLESVAVHEIGHLIGLGHSAVGVSEPRAGGGRRLIAAGAAMYPIAFAPGNIDGRLLRPDDRAGAGDLYPAAAFRQQTGSISGSVTRGGRGLFGAHLIAFHAASGRLVGGFALDDEGRFAIAGLEPGVHLLRVEPLDPAEVESFFAPAAAVETGFRVTYADRLLVVPRGGNARIDIRVQP